MGCSLCRHELAFWGVGGHTGIEGTLDTVVGCLIRAMLLRAEVGLVQGEQLNASSWWECPPWEVHIMRRSRASSVTVLSGIDLMGRELKVRAFLATGM